MVVAARDAEGSLEAAARSALAAGDVVQVVLVDDASTDGTLAVARGMAERDPRVEVVARPVRGGPSLARDDGLVGAVGTRVCVLDADDVLLDGGIAALGDALDAAPAAVCAVGRFRAVDAQGDPADVGAWADDQLRGVVRRDGRIVADGHGLSPEALVTRLVSPPPGAWLADAATVRALGGFDVTVPRSEDLELLVRLAFAGEVVVVDREVLAYRRHASQRSAAVTRRRVGRAGALLAMLRAAPSPAAARRLARGMAAYHLELFVSRRGATSVRVRAMGARNLLAALVLRAGGPLVAALPRRLPAPLLATPRSAVD